MAEKKVVQQAKPVQQPIKPAPKAPVQPTKPAGKK